MKRCHLGGVTILLALAGLMPSALLAQSEQATHVIMVQVGDAYRSVQLHIPDGHDGETPLPLVFNLHGSGGTAERQELLSAMSTVADENQFLVAGGMAVYEFPEGRVTWNADLDPNGVSDVDYIRAAIDAIDRKAKVDRRRIFATGMSGGGRMSSRIGCELADVIAAVAPVAGVQFGAGCNPVRAIPLITFHALDDNTNKYFEGNKDRNPNWVAGIEGALESWASNNECDTAPTSTMITEDVTRISHKDCKDGADVVLYQTKSGGHSWPGTPIAKAFKERGRMAPNMDIDASRLIWEFFELHPLP